MPRKYKKKKNKMPPKQYSLNWYKWKAVQAYDVATAVRKLVNVEKKKLDLSHSGNILSSTTSARLNFTAIATGDGPNQREGNSIKVVRLYGKGTIRVNSASTSTASNLRVVIIRDNQQIADTTPTWTDIYALADHNSLLNTATVGRYSVLWDRRYTVSNQNGSPGRAFEFNIPLQQHVRYNSTASTDIQKNGMYMFAISDESVNGVDLSVQARTTYIDN